MASYTGNLNLKKPALDDDALITDINNNMDILDAAVNGIQDGLAIVANGNTHVAITSGQFVYVRNHGTLTEGLYVASTNIAANATLSSSNLTADAAGGLNALNSKIMQANETISDCNNAVNGRAYNFITGVLHGPDFHYGTLFQIGTMLNSSAYKMQIACDVVDNHIAFRRTPNDSWGDESWNELALNSKTGKQTSVTFDTSSDLKTWLLSKSAEIGDNGVAAVKIGFNADIEGLPGWQTYSGHIYTQFAGYSFTLFATSETGNDITISYLNGTWKFKSLNSKISGLGLTNCFQFNLTAGNYEATAYDNRFVADRYYLVLHGLQNEKTNIYIKQCTTSGQLVCNAVTGGPFKQYDNFAFGIGNL